MSRGVGVTRALAEWLEPAEPLFAALTQLGDTWLLAAVAVSLYALGPTAPVPGWDRRRGATLLAVVLLAVATTGLLKSTVALPRPPGAGQPAVALDGVLGDLYARAATASGYGIPSGHALGATAVYGTFAGLLPASSRRHAGLVVAGLVAAVAVSRLALGVHYAVDVAAGVVAGLVLAAVALRWAARPFRVFASGVIPAAGWTLATGGVPAALGAVGLPAGAILAWAWLEDRLLAAPSGPALAGGSLLIGIFVLSAIELGGPPVAAVGGFVGMATIVALPLAAE